MTQSGGLENLLSAVTDGSDGDDIEVVPEVFFNFSQAHEKTSQTARTTSSLSNSSKIQEQISMRSNTTFQSFMKDEPGLLKVGKFMEN